MNTLSLNFIAPRSVPHVSLAVPVALATTAAVIGTAAMIMPGLNAALLSGVVVPAENLWHAQCTHVSADILVAFVLFLAGFVSGLSGFAFSAVAACILWLLPPFQAVPLIMMLSLCNQIQLFLSPNLRQQIVWRSTEGRDGALPYIAGGFLGIPFGVAILRSLPASMFACGLGAFLVLYSGYMLLKPEHLKITAKGWKPAVAIGTAGGIVGGFSGFPGSMPVVYLGLRGVSKAAMRGITLPYILAMQIAALGTLVLTNMVLFNKQFWILWAFTLPSVLLGSAAGVRMYRRMSDVNFQRTVLALLTISGFSLMVKTLI
jgi:uncharacterized protein